MGYLATIPFVWDIMYLCEITVIGLESHIHTDMCSCMFQK